VLKNKDKDKKNMKTGVYLCGCGGNISKVVDLDNVKEYVDKEKDVEITQIHTNMCSGAGQKLIIDDIKKHGLDKIVVSACSPQFHEKTFRSAMAKADLNPHVLEIANFREHCSWPLKKQPEIATEKAKSLVNVAIDKVSLNYPLEKKMFKMENKVCVIGAGIAGIQASLDLSAAGKDVILIEKDPTIGGKMTILSKTFPTEDCSACIISAKMAEAEGDPNIKVYTNTKITKTSGHRLHFDIEAEVTPRFVIPDINMDICLTCKKCEEVCPVSVPNEWEKGIMDRKAIYTPAPLAIPFKYLIDEKNCLQFKDGSCTKCADVCPENFIDFTQKMEKVNFTVDNIIIATGFDDIDPNIKPMFKYEELENVVTGLEMERIVDHCNENPPPKEIGNKVAFIQCVGSRDKQIGNEYCSRVCCMYATKQASLLKMEKPETDIYIFYTDLRAYGKGFEEYYKRAQEMGIKYIRGKVAEINKDPRSSRIILRAEDTLSRKLIETDFDMIVLANGMRPNQSSGTVLDSLKLDRSSDGFVKEAHLKYRPVDTLVEGVFVAGAAQGPKDIPDTVAQASAAAARSIGSLNQKEFEIDPILAFVDSDKCDGCEDCLTACPKNAIQMDSNNKAVVDGALCVGGGSCIGSCHAEAIDLKGYTNEQMYASIDAILELKKKDEHRVVFFADDASSYRLADMVGVRKMAYDHNVYIMRVPSGSRITHNLIAYAFIKGADGVIIGDNVKDSSAYPWSKEISLKQIELVNEKLKKSGIKGDRIFYSELKSGMIQQFLDVVNGTVDTVKKYPKITEVEVKKLEEL
ncbi:MAG: FAD-dependent oxidoreductase, partial [Bacteroidota bacterium]|nr:FAD-dependent oxidoreductase [Bacteroidota bacterium]